MKTQNYLATADLAYNDMKEETFVTGIDNVRYKVVKALHTKSGYDGYILYRKDTNELVVAHRGTWPEKNSKTADILTDLGMAIDQGNNQYPNAKKLTEIAISLSKTEYPGAKIHQSGHSLGGALAQLCGYNYGQRTETFNAYGAANLQEKQPGKQSNAQLITNHVRGMDPVSAASPHLGNVKHYLNKTEQKVLYLGGFGKWNIALNHTWAVAITGAGYSHGLNNFKNGGLSTKEHTFALDNIQLIKEFRTEFEEEARKVGKDIKFRKDIMNDAINWGKKTLNLSENSNISEDQFARLFANEATNSNLLAKEQDTINNLASASSTTQRPQSKYDEVKGMLRGLINDTDGSYAQRVLAEHPEQVALFDEKIRQNIALNQDRQQELVAEKSQAFQHEEQQRVFSRSFG